MSPKPLIKKKLDELKRQGHRLPIPEVKAILEAEVESQAVRLRKELAEQEASRLQQIVAEVVTPANIGAAYGSLYGLKALPKKGKKRVIQEGAAPFGSVSGEPETVAGSLNLDTETL